MYIETPFMRELSFVLMWVVVVILSLFFTAMWIEIDRSKILRKLEILNAKKENRKECPYSWVEQPKKPVLNKGQQFWISFLIGFIICTPVGIFIAMHELGFSESGHLGWIFGIMFGIIFGLVLGLFLWITIIDVAFNGIHADCNRD